MHNRENVIKWLEYCEIGSSDRCYETECPYYGKGCTESLKNDILAMLKEQKAVEPETDSEGTCSCGNCGETVGWFPVGCSIPNKLCKFCPECGQAVKWRENT